MILVELKNYWTNEVSLLGGYLDMLSTILEGKTRTQGHSIVCPKKNINSARRVDQE